MSRKSLQANSSDKGCQACNEKATQDDSHPFFNEPRQILQEELSSVQAQAERLAAEQERLEEEAVGLRTLAKEVDDRQSRFVAEQENARYDSDHTQHVSILAVPLGHCKSCGACRYWCLEFGESLYSNFITTCSIENVLQGQQQGDSGHFGSSGGQPVREQKRPRCSVVPSPAEAGGIPRAGGSLQGAILPVELTDCIVNLKANESGTSLLDLQYISACLWLEGPSLIVLQKGAVEVEVAMNEHVKLQRR